MKLIYEKKLNATEYVKIFQFGNTIYISHPKRKKFNCSMRKLDEYSTIINWYDKTD